jgi:electron transport complex protein RnfB
MADDIYYRLQKHLDNFVMRAPESDSFIEILKIRFTSEEAKIALILNQMPEDIPTLAKSADMDEGSLGSILEQMADKVLVFKQKQKIAEATKDVYSLLPTAVGLWETSFAKGEKNPKTEELARLWREYYKDGWGKAMLTPGTPFLRVIPVRQSLKGKQEIYPYEQASELIKQQDYACVLHCACRKSAELDGKGCGKPTDVCMHFGDLAKFFVEKGYARKIEIKEAMEILDTTDKAGLLHMVSNSKEMGVALCSCCTCCCTQMRAIAEMQIAEPIARSRFVARVDADDCTACSTCEDRCMVEAIKVADDIAELKDIQCIGCGLCVTGCPEEAISLTEREGYTEPVDSIMDLVVAWLRP